MNIDIVVANKIARAPLDAEIVCGNDDYTVTFDFDSEWDSHPVKTARFIYIKCGRVRYEEVPFEGRICNVPLLSNVTRVDVGVYAGDLRTTTAAMIKCKRSILCDGGVPEEPSEDVYNQLMELINQKLIDPNTPVDQVFDADSENPQSGKALRDVVIKTVNSPKIWELDAGVYRVSGEVSYGKFESSVKTNIINLMKKVGFLMVGLNPLLSNQRDFYLFADGKVYFGYSVDMGLKVEGAISGEFSKVAKEISTASTPDEIPTAEAVVEYVNETLEGIESGGGGSDYTLPIGGDELGGVKNGGNVVINEDGTMTAYVSSLEPMHDDIPKVFFEGDITGMTKDNEKILNFAYKSKTEQFNGYVKMKWQGSSSLSFPKKNFTIKMFSDETCETKLKRTFKDWKHEGNKFVLKANYIDHTHARNIVTANLWTEIVASRSDYESLPNGLKNSPKNGAIDGFPIKLYLNGKYEGLYTWNIGKDGWMFGVDEDNVNQAVICAKKNNGGISSTTDRNILACEFRANANIDGNDWDLEMPDVLHNNIKTSFNNLINCVKDTDDETFKSTIGNHLDVTSALDYYILMYFSCAVDNLANNLIMVTYDGAKWYCSAYDLDNIWGSRGTNTFVAQTFPCPEGYQDTNSLLWQRIEKCFANELYERYQIIRKNVLTFANVVDKFERFCDLIGTELYAEDVTIYSDIPYPTQNNLNQIRNFFTPRAEYVDACFAEIAKGEPDASDGITTVYSLNEPVTITSASDCFDTGVALWNADRDFTIAFNVTSNDTSTIERTVFATNAVNSPWQGIKFDVAEFYRFSVSGNTYQVITTQIPSTYTDAIKAVVTHVAETDRYTIKYQYGGEIIEKTTTSKFVPQTNNMWVGADNGWTGSPNRAWLGTINEFAIYYGVMSDKEIEAFLTT